jgi:NTP pyrophosphatase (non-canonical NTP hydrolase)
VTLQEYQVAALKLDRNPGGPLWYPCLGLSGEVGEVIEHIKKNYRDGKPLERKALIGELGDVLWYLTCLATRLDYTLEEVAQANIAKLQDRAVNGKQPTPSD